MHNGTFEANFFTELLVKPNIRSELFVTAMNTDAIRKVILQTKDNPSM
jgi:hypothetical protein